MAASQGILSHCKREVIHAVCLLLMDDKFMEAYMKGIVFRFVDGVFRRGFIRFVTHSADYPEKCVHFCVL
jgi:hypothetical protein